MIRFINFLVRDSTIGTHTHVTARTPLTRDFSIQPQLLILSLVFFSSIIEQGGMPNREMVFFFCCFATKLIPSQYFSFVLCAFKDHVFLIRVESAMSPHIIYYNII